MVHDIETLTMALHPNVLVTSYSDASSVEVRRNVGRIMALNHSHGLN